MHGNYETMASCSSSGHLKSLRRPNTGCCSIRSASQTMIGYRRSLSFNICARLWFRLPSLLNGGSILTNMCSTGVFVQKPLPNWKHLAIQIEEDYGFNVSPNATYRGCCIGSKQRRWSNDVPCPENRMRVQVPLAEEVWLQQSILVTIHNLYISR